MKKSIKRILAVICALTLIAVTGGYPAYASEIENPGAVQETTSVAEESKTDSETSTEETDKEETVSEIPADETEKGEESAEETPSVDTEEKEETPAVETEEVPEVKDAKSLVQYSAHVQEIGWQKEVADGATAGTTGQNKRIEAFKVKVDRSEYAGNIEYRAHVSQIGWQDYVKDGAVAGTTGQSKQVEAVQMRLKGSLAEKYDIYYRIHSANFGWLGWACNDEIAGTSGWGYAAQAMEIRLVEKGGKAPGSTEDAHIPSMWEFDCQQMEETTEVGVNLKSLKQIMKQKSADTVKLTATMEYKGKITRTVSIVRGIEEIVESGLTIDVKDYGKFNLTAQFQKNGKTVASKTKSVGVTASEYNIAPLSATFPVVQFSLSLWDIRANENGVVPTVVMLDRPSAYNWNELPKDVYALPYLTKKNTYDYTAFKDYVKELYALNPNSKFNLYINDITCSYIHSIIYANKIPEGQYTIKLLSDGSGSFGIFNQSYAGDNPAQKHQTYVKAWNDAKAQAYKTGQVTSDWGWHKHWDCMYAVLTCEPGAEWWVSRNNLFNTSDPAFTEKVKNDVTVKNIGNMLKDLQAKGETVVKEFKELYNFNDGYFDEAYNQGKKAMMLLGTYVNYEQQFEGKFEDYARLTQLYYGDDYLYYYKGHPNTPTEMWPVKQEELNKLGITDVDSAVAAELILFFNPEISLSGYSTSTFNAASDEMACGLFNMTKQAALSSGGGVDYSGIDWFATKINKDQADQALAELCTGDNSYYLLEFSDQILDKGEFDIAVYNATKGELKFCKKDGEKYKVVKTQREKAEMTYRAHVSYDGWQNYVQEGKTAGTTGEKKALQAIEMELNNIDGKISYQSHVAQIGWQDWVSNGETSGTIGKNLPMEAVRIKLEGEASEAYDIYYRVHAQDYGWLDWAKNGAPAGTEGYGKRLEAIQVKMVEKGGKAPGEVKSPFKRPKVAYKTHVQDYGWQSYVFDGKMSGTQGKSKRLEGIAIKNMDSDTSGSIQYRTHIQDYGWEKDWKRNGTVSGTVGKSKRLEAINIKLTGELAEKYDVYYRVHAQDFGWLDWAKNGKSAGTAGYSKRLEGIEIRYVEKGGKAPGSTKRPYVER